MPFNFVCKIKQLFSYLASPPLFSTPFHQPHFPTQTPAWWDNANSFHLTNDMSLLYNITPLTSPVSVGGIGGGRSFTHQGCLKCLPTNMNLCYYSSTVDVTLLSLGYIHRQGGAYRTDSSQSTPHTLVFISPLLPPVDNSPLNDINLLPVNFQSLHRASLLHPHLFPSISAVSYIGSWLAPPPLLSRFNITALT
jgi:hypothetical protein